MTRLFISHGRQHVPGYSVATFGDIEQAILPVDPALATTPDLDNTMSTEILLLIETLEGGG